MKKINLYLILFTIISLLNLTIVNQKLIWFLLFFLLIVLFVSNQIVSIEFLILSMIFPDRIIQIIGLVIFSMWNITRFKISKNKFTVLFIGYLAVESLFNCLVFDTSLINFFMQSSVYIIYLITIGIMQDYNLDLNKITGFMKKIAYLQCIVGISQMLYYKKIDDAIKGTFINAHFMCIFILITIYLLYKKHKNIKDAILKNKLSVILYLFIIYISDAKHVYGAFVVSCLIFIILSKIIKKNYTVILGISLLFIVILSVDLLKVQRISNYITTNFSVTSEYVYRDEYNQKYRYFDRTFEMLKSFKGLIGFGLGEYGSQTASFRAYETIYRTDDTEKRAEIIKPYCNELYRVAIEDLMVKNYVANIKNISMVLSFPIVSFIPFIAEIGLVGFVMWLIILQKICKHKTDNILTIFFMLLTIFDIYFEIPSVFIIIILGALIPCKSKADEH